MRGLKQKSEGTWTHWDNNLDKKRKGERENKEKEIDCFLRTLLLSSQVSLCKFMTQ